MAAKTTSLQDKKQGDVPLSLIRKLTTEKAVKAHRQQTKEKAATADEITNIKLSGRGIKTIESLELPSLRRLDLSKNNLNRLKGLQSCPEVTYLIAAGNELTGEGLDGVRPLRDLKVFNASGNRVRRIPPTVFAQFRQLQALVLNNNEIAEVPPTWFKKGLLTLNTIVLSHNRVKSLSDTGLGRLTVLTKISVSHNELCELPDLSACSALEELRAAHNLISEVPSSLGKNVALRTLDLGHNTIEGWGGLERVGKTLASLVQITLAGNPLCTNAPSGPEASSTGGEDGGTEGAAAREGEGEYVTKIRSLFPSLKVRDGKRILMKKSHTYYEQRAADANANPDATEGFPAPSEAGGKFGGGGRPGKGSGDGFGGGGDGRMVDGQKPTRRLKGAPAAVPAAAAAAAAIAGKDENKSGNDRTSSGNTEKARRREARRRLKKEAARAPVGGAEGARIEGDGGGAGAAVASGLPGGTSDERNRLAEDDEDPAGVRSKKKKRRREAKDSPETAAAAGAPGERTQRRDSEKAVAERIAGTAQDKKQRTKKKTKATASAKAPTGEGGRAVNEVSGGGDGGDKDPYSSSEELPVAGKRAGKSAGGIAKGGVGSGAKRAAQEGDRESGVVSVVLNRKRKGAKGTKGKAWQAVGDRGVLQCDDAEAGGGGGEGEFSVEGMLAARGQRETVGLGLGVSAWG